MSYIEETNEEVRSRRGAFYTPTIWSFKSKEYLAKALGDDWQDNYYVWDCCCGTGNLCNGLYNQDRVFMSTIDQQDIDTMIQNKILQDASKFQFDFLNDEWKPINDIKDNNENIIVQGGGKLPNKLYNIIHNEPEKLVIYINPPYVESGNKRVVASGGRERNKVGVSTVDVFVQFYQQIYNRMNGCVIACFSKLKHLNASKLEKFRINFKAKFLKGFICRSTTFDNVKGEFPISFQIWNTSIKQDFPNEVEFDIYTKIGRKDEEGKPNHEGTKKVLTVKKGDYITDWLKEMVALSFAGNTHTTNKTISEIQTTSEQQLLGQLYNLRNDVQHSNYLQIQDSWTTVSSTERHQQCKTDSNSIKQSTQDGNGLPLGKRRGT